MNPTMKFRVAAELSRRRHASGFGRDALDKQADLPAGTVEMAERANREIAAADLWRLARALGASASAFLPEPALAPAGSPDQDRVQAMIGHFRCIDRADRRRAIVRVAEALAARSSGRNDVEGEADAARRGPKRDGPVIEKRRK